MLPYAFLQFTIRPFRSCPVVVNKLQNCITYFLHTGSRKKVLSNKMVKSHVLTFDYIYDSEQNIGQHKFENATALTCSIT